MESRIYDLDALGLKFDEVFSQFIGVNGVHEGPGGQPSPDIAEVMLRVGVRSKGKAAVERFTKELALLTFSGPPTLTGFGGGDQRSKRSWLTGPR